MDMKKIDLSGNFSSQTKDELFTTFQTSSQGLSETEIAESTIVTDRLSTNYDNNNRVTDYTETTNNNGIITFYGANIFNITQIDPMI